MAKVVVVRGPDKGKSIKLSSGDPQVMGRKDAPLLMTDAQMSRKHCEFFKQDGEWFVKDLGSSNGTFVNNAKIGNPVALKDGDSVKLGRTKLVFRRGASIVQPRPDPDKRMAAAAADRPDPPGPRGPSTRPSAPTTPTPPAAAKAGRPAEPAPPRPTRRPAPADLPDFDANTRARDEDLDASALAMDILASDDETGDEVTDEYIPDWDPVKPDAYKQYRQKVEERAGPDAKTVVPGAVKIDVELSESQVTDDSESSRNDDDSDDIDVDDMDDDSEEEDEDEDEGGEDEDEEEGDDEGEEDKQEKSRKPLLGRFGLLGRKKHPDA